MVAEAPWASEENVAEDLYTCSLLRLRVISVFQAHIVQGNAIVFLQEVLQGNLALKLVI